MNASRGELDPHRDWASRSLPHTRASLLRLLMLWTAPPSARECQRCGPALGCHDSEELPMQTIATIGLDIAKSVFQVHGVEATGQVVVRRQLKRRHVLEFFAKLPPCLVGIEACASSHYWARELQAVGHIVRLIPPAYVKPYGAPRRRALPVEEGST